MKSFSEKMLEAACQYNPADLCRFVTVAPNTGLREAKISSSFEAG